MSTLICAALGSQISDYLDRNRASARSLERTHASVSANIGNLAYLQDLEGRIDNRGNLVGNAVRAPDGRVAAERRARISGDLVSALNRADNLMADAHNMGNDRLANWLSLAIQGLEPQYFVTGGMTASADYIAESMRNARQLNFPQGVPRSPDHIVGSTLSTEQLKKMLKNVNSANALADFGHRDI